MLKVKQIYVDSNLNFFEIGIVDSPDYMVLSDEIANEAYVSVDVQKKASFSGLTHINYEVRSDVFEDVVIRNVRSLYPDLQAQHALSVSTKAVERSEAWKGDTETVRTADAYEDVRTNDPVTDTVTNEAYEDLVTTDQYQDPTNDETVEPTQKTKTNSDEKVTETSLGERIDTFSAGNRRETTTVRGNPQDPDVTEKVASPEDLAHREQLFYVYALSKLIECVHRSIIEAAEISEYMDAYQTE